MKKTTVAMMQRAFKERGLAEIQLVEDAAKLGAEKERAEIRAIVVAENQRMAGECNWDIGEFIDNVLAAIDARSK